MTFIGNKIPFFSPILRNASKLVLCLLIISSSDAGADIYRFVTVDGVETFTDAPLHKEAKVIIKESSKSPTAAKSKKKQKNHDISLNEIVEKTVSASIATTALKASTMAGMTMSGSKVQRMGITRGSALPMPAGTGQ